MKKINLILFFILALGLVAIGQDTLIRTNGDTLLVRIKKMNRKNISYINLGDPRGILWTLKKTEFNKISRAIIPMDCSTIVVYTHNTDSANFIQFKKHLLKYDYFIDRSDANIYTIATDFHALKTHPGWSHSYRYKILFSEGEIIIKPYWRSGVTMSLYGVRSTDDEIRWKYSRVLGNVNTIIYNETLDMLSHFPAYKISYR
jgi:hypothetical protein